MQIAHILTDLIGNTPLLALERYAPGARILAKLECFNPLSSAKDRTALYMIRDAEERGLLRPGSVLVEPTSGNTGVGLSYIAALRGYRVILTMPETMSAERRSLLSALGAELVLTPGPAGMQGAIDKANELLDALPGAWMPAQFDNPANARAHYETTGPEIWRDTDGTVDIYVAGVGTGGTVTGVGAGTAWSVLLDSIIVVVVGGTGSIQGALLGGLILGLANSFGTAYLPDLTIFLKYLVLIIVLLIKPSGLLGKYVPEKV